MAGVPAKRIGWVGRAGVPLDSIDDNRFRCPTTGATYKEQSPNKLIEEKLIEKDM
jgi:UDP-2-acetamido-3-amino-2,3-dideoxy-glucuronate N-acetyltransferase